MPKTKPPVFYAVAKAPSLTAPAIFTSWEDCERLVSKGKGAFRQGAKFKKFASLSDAWEYCDPDADDGTSESVSPPYKRIRKEEPIGSPVCEISATGSIKDQSPLRIYTDGACSKNGRKGAQAGWGVWYGDGDPRNLYGPVTGQPTNQRGELEAILKALQATKDHGGKVEILSDSKYAISCATEWISKWHKNGFKTATGKPVLNADFIKPLNGFKGTLANMGTKQLMPLLAREPPCLQIIFSAICMSPLLVNNKETPGVRRQIDSRRSGTFHDNDFTCSTVPSGRPASPIVSPKACDDTARRVSVFVRLKDLCDHDPVVRLDSCDPTLLVVPNSSGSSLAYKFDKVFPPECLQGQIFEDVAQPLLRNFIGGYNGTILAYGQSGSGKTYTIEGHQKCPELAGLVPRIADSLLSEIAMNQDSTKVFEVKLSVMEIYCERLRDLLGAEAKDDLKVREEADGSTYIEGICEISLRSRDHFVSVYRHAQRRRAVGQTDLNEHSSRSHLIVTFYLLQENLIKRTKLTSKFNVVDLAGSERVRKSKAEGLSFEEARRINFSLSALGNVINALTAPDTSHIPYRDSKLTRVLADALGGNSMTALIVCVVSSREHEQETLSTLRFGKRSQLVMNRLTKDEVHDDKYAEQCRKLEEISAYASSLERLIQNAGIHVPNQITEKRSRLNSLPDLDIQTRGQTPRFGQRGNQNSVDNYVEDCVQQNCSSIAEFRSLRSIAEKTVLSRLGSTEMEQTKSRAIIAPTPDSPVDESPVSSDDEEALTPKSTALVSALTQMQALSLRYSRLEHHNMMLTATLRAKSDQIHHLQHSLRSAHRQYNTLFEQYEKIFMHHHPRASRCIHRPKSPSSEESMLLTPLVVREIWK